VAISSAIFLGNRLHTWESLHLITHAAPPTEGWHTRVKGLNYVLLHWHQSPVSIPGWRRIVPEPATRDSYAICSVAVLLFFDPLKPFHVIWGAKQILQPACFASMLSCSSGEPLAFPSVPLLPSLNHPLMHHILLQHPQPVIVIETQDTCETHNPCCYPWMQNSFSSPR